MRRWGVGVALSLVLALAGTSPAGAEAGADAGWQPCTADLECRTITVPVDYSQPHGPTWTIPLSRYPASTQPAPRGALLVNEGGPGIPGLGAPGYTKAWQPLHDDYDIVGFDPRGVGASVPSITCLSPAQKERIRGQVSAPRTTAQQRRSRRLGRLQGAACQAKWADYLPHLGTANVARDMDQIRRTLGLAQISYLGFSYGTFLGAMYADLFPGRTDRVVLDSAMNPALDYPTLRRDQAVEQNTLFGRFLRDCLDHADCPFPSARQGRRHVAAVIGQLDRDPFRRGARTLSGSRALGLMESANYSPQSLWPGLRKVWAAAVRGDLRPMLRASYSDAQMVNPADSQYLGVVCIDFQMQRRVLQPQRLAGRWARKAPFSGANRAWSLQPCETWPASPVRRPAPLKAPGSGPIMVVGNTFDPATPLRWGRALSRQLAHASLLEVRGDGHLSWWSNDCARLRMTNFLLTGRRPAGGSVCPRDR